MSAPAPGKVAPGRVALVTGARRGIGRAVALGLAQAGYAVALNDLADSEELAAAVAAAKAHGVAALGVVGDIARLDEHARLLDRVEAGLGPLTTLINNAGVSVLRRGDLLEVAPESYDRCLEVNTRGTFFLTQAFARRLLARARPESVHHAIVTITSCNAVAVSVNRGEYCISKAGLSMASRLFAARLGAERIGVYEVQPGVIETEMTAPSKPTYERAIAAGLTAIPRLGQAAEIAEIVLTLAEGRLPYTAGQIIRAEGGLLTPRF